MNADTAQRLIDLNRQFYQSQAASFSATRGRLQPGVLRVLENLPLDAAILDLGCGNGNLAAELAHRGHRGPYLGLDFSEELLQIARANLPLSTFTFLQADLTDPDWLAQLPVTSYQSIFAFAVLHHLPGRDLRLQLLRQMRGLLAPGSRFVHSNWIFLNSPRLRERIQPWAAAGLDDADLDPGDYLLDWRHGSRGLRYVHHFSEEELAALAAESGFQVAETFTSDGETGDLGLYEIWRKK